MRVISGISKGRKLKTPQGMNVRPTADSVKEAVFNIIRDDIIGRRVLDLFAGSGQMGIEALSRGCASSVFVDVSKESAKIIKENIAVCKFEEESRVVNSDFSVFLATCKDTFDIAFLDPPYKAGLLQKALLGTTRVMSNFGIIICEHPTDISLPDKAGDFKVSKVYRYGKINLTVYKKENENE